MSQVDYCGVVKTQLMDYYKGLNERTVSLSEEVVIVDGLTGEWDRILLAPVGLRDELRYTRDEILWWMHYEENML